MFRFCLFLCFCSLGPRLAAQYVGQTKWSVEEIQADLSRAIEQKDLKAQAKAWYEWALFTEKRSGLTQQAFDYLERSVKLFSEARDTLGMHCAEADLADRLATIGEYRGAIQKQEAALRYFRAVGQELLEIQLLTRMIRTYQLEGNRAQEKAYRVLFANKNARLRDTTLQLGIMVEDVAYLQQNNQYAAAVPLAREALVLAERIGHGPYSDRALFLLAVGLSGLGEYKPALARLREAERRSLWREDAWERLRLLQTYSEAYRRLDSLPQAFAYLQAYAALGDSLRSWSTAYTIQAAAVEFQTNQKTRDLEVLKGKNEEIARESKLQQRQNWMLGVLLLLSIGGGYYLYHDYRHRSRAYQRQLRDEQLITQQQAEINAQKIRELEDRNKIENMQSMLEGQESERKRIAYDLHDSLGGLLATTKLQLEQLRTKFPKVANDSQLLKLKELMDATVTETRLISRNLQPNLKFGLVKALRDQVGLLQNEGGPEISFQAVGNFDCLDKTTMLHCYRIVQELLQNSLKYAQATEILVQITENEGQISLLVEDDGHGFDLETAQRGMGLNNIEHRVEFLKGEISLQSNPETGTSTLITVPVEPCGEKEE